MLAKDRPERLRDELNDLSGSFLVVTDGKMLWRAAPDTRESMRTAAAISLRWAQLAVNFMAPRMTDHLIRAEETGTSAWIWMGG